MTDRLLYQFGDSPCCMKVRMVQAYKGLNWKEQFIESWKFDHFQPNYLAINPYGIVPTLVDHGHVVTQSNVIVEHLEDAYPDKPLRPCTPHLRARMRKWMYIEQEFLFGHIVTLSFNSMMKLWVEGFGLEKLQKWSFRHPDQEKAQSYLERLTAPVDTNKDPAARDGHRSRLVKLNTELEANKTLWICGDEPSLAEVALAGIFDRLIYLEEETLFQDLPDVSEWFVRLKNLSMYRDGEHKFSARMWGPEKPVAEFRNELR
jgi:glutathione S-transferase